MVSFIFDPFRTLHQGFYFLLLFFKTLGYLGDSVKHLTFLRAREGTKDKGGREREKQDSPGAHVFT